MDIRVHLICVQIQLLIVISSVTISKLREIKFEFRFLRPSTLDSSIFLTELLRGVTKTSIENTVPDENYH